MQWHGSTNKSPTKLNAAEIKFDTGVCLRMGKTTEAKPYWVISIKNFTKPFDLSRNTNLQLNPYPNTQFDLYCSGNLSIQCTNPST